MASFEGGCRLLERLVSEPKEDAGVVSWKASGTFRGKVYVGRGPYMLAAVQAVLVASGADAQATEDERLFAKLAEAENRLARVRAEVDGR